MDAFQEHDNEKHDLRALETSDGSFSAGRQIRALHGRSRALTWSVVGLALLNVAVLGVAIWAGVTAQRAQDDANSLAASSSATYSSSAPDASASGSSAAAGSGSGGSSVYLSSSAVPPQGYSYAGSVYRGSGYWSNTSSNLPAPRADFAAVPVGERVYIFGGQDGSSFLDSTTVYDAVLDRYATDLAAMPEPRARLAAAAVDNDTIVVVGGFKDSASLDAGAAEPCPLVYTLSANTWAVGGACMPAAVADACAAGTDGVLYLAGGTVQGRPSDAIYAFDPAGPSWTVVGALPSPRTGAACAALDGKLFVAGGRSDAGLLNELVSLDPPTASVRTLAPLPYGAGNVALLTLPNGRLLAIGGTVDASAGVQAALHYTEEYILALDTWVEKAPIATSRLGTGAAYANGAVFVYGGRLTGCAAGAVGCSPSEPLASVEAFYDIDHPDVFVHLPDPAAATGGNPVPQPPESKVLLSSSNAPLNGFTNAGLLHAGSGYWADEEQMPVGLSDFAAVSYGNLILIPGGTLADTSTSADLWQFDTLLSQYTRLAPMPEPRSRYGAAILNDRLYVVGGFSSNTSAETGTPAEGMMVYDIASGNWTTSPAGLVTPRSDACMAALDGKLYIAGGYTTNYTDVLASVEVYDPNEGTWTELARPMPTPRGDVMCAAFEESFVVVGGYYDPSRQWLPSSFRTEVEAYSPTDNDWTTLAPIPQGRGDNTLVQLPGNRMMVMGGETNTETRTKVATSQVDLYLAAYDLWVPMAPMPEPRFRFDAAYANGFVYVFGGQATSLCEDPEGFVCTTRTRASAAKYLDIDYPDVFVFLADA